MTENQLPTGRKHHVQTLANANHPDTLTHLTMATEAHETPIHTPL